MGEPNAHPAVRAALNRRIAGRSLNSMGRVCAGSTGTRLLGSLMGSESLTRLIEFKARSRAYKSRDHGITVIVVMPIITVIATPMRVITFRILPTIFPLSDLHLSCMYVATCPCCLNARVRFASLICMVSVSFDGASNPQYGLRFFKHVKHRQQIIAPGPRQVHAGICCPVAGTYSRSRP